MVKITRRKIMRKLQGWELIAKPRKQGAIKTTISVSWDIKNTIRKFANPTKSTKIGQNYESDEQVIKKILEHYNKTNSGGNITNTYPTRPKI